jgi:hypothetical protein
LASALHVALLGTGFDYAIYAIAEFGVLEPARVAFACSPWRANTA